MKNFKERLESLVQSRWTDVLDKHLVLKSVLETVRDTDYRVIKQTNDLKKEVKLILTKFAIANLRQFEVWIEFSVPKNGGVVVGTNTYSLDLTGELSLKESHAVLMITEKT